jgi:CheY-like chemotaxis protein
MRTILIVDDEFGVVDALSAVLEDAGYRVLTAHNGRMALERLTEGLPDLVLLDYIMPVLDGCETLRALRRREDARALPVVLMSGIPESMVRRRCTSYQAFLRKPFGLDELIQTLTSLLGRQGLARRKKAPKPRLH